MTTIRLTQSILPRLLFVAVAVVLMANALRFFAFTTFMRDDLTSVVSTQLEALSRDMAQDVEYKIAERRRMLVKTASAIPLHLLDRPSLVRRWLREHHDLNPLFPQDFFVARLDGIPIASYRNAAGRQEMDFSDRDFFRTALAGEFAIGRATRDSGTNEPILPFAAPIKDEVGTVRAVLVGVTSLDATGFLEPIHRGHVGSTGGYLLISPEEQIFIAASKPELILRPTAPAGVNRLHDQALKGFRGSGVTVNAQGVEEIAAFASVPSTGWFTVARLPTEEAFVLLAHSKAFFLTTGLAVSVILIAAMVLLAILFFRPLHRAADLAARMSRGELPFQHLPVTRADEVGYLTMAFNQLLDKLLLSQAEQAELARRDALTGLPNRIELSERLRKVQARAQRQGSLASILFLDLDGFKAINDSLGHQAGDEALIQVARKLSGILREEDTLARIGGDEFVIVLGDLAQDQASAAAYAVATKCIAALQEPIAFDGQSRQLGLSVGIVLSNGQRALEELISAADLAMYDAKKQGGNRFVLADVERKAAS